MIWGLNASINWSYLFNYVCVYVYVCAYVLFFSWHLLGQASVLSYDLTSLLYCSFFLSYFYFICIGVLSACVFV